MARKLEIECKLICDDRKTLAALPQMLAPLCERVTARGLVLVQDAYLDTPDQRLLRSGYACRIRRERGRRRLNLKELRRARRGVARRVEIDLPVPKGFPRTLRNMPKRGAGRELARIISDQPLRVIFRIANRRREYGVRVCHPHPATLRVSADDFRVIAGGRSERLAEVEIELLSGDPRAPRALAVALCRIARGLSFGRRTKFARGLALGTRA